jgi:antitoxin component of MazEF toxin-antitoxin module
MTAPHGPHRIGQNRQVALPVDLMSRVHLRPGDEVYLQVNDDPPGTLLVIPMEIATKWFETGKRASAHGAEDEAFPATET